MSKIRIRTKKGWIAYSGSTIQQNYSEELRHGYLLWDIRDRRSHDVSFCELPNVKPFVTIDWQGSFQATFDEAQKCAKGSRFRIRSTESISQGETTKLTNELRSKMIATEVTYKNDEQINHELINTGDISVVKNDLRNLAVLTSLVKDYYRDSKITPEEWVTATELIQTYLKSGAADDESARNAKWTLRHLKFDNLFAYGEGNEIRFESLNGITGIFGPNRVGKSSIVGAIMYALFNDTDRGSIKNLHVVNARKPFGYSRAIINVNGSDYVIERQTVKHENREGEMNANTHLNLFKLDEKGELIDLNGEQRSDTEKTVRRLIGTSDDYALTSLSTQEDINHFINEGATKRKTILSKFLDLDIFDKMHDVAKNDLNNIRTRLKFIPDQDWDALMKVLAARKALFESEAKVLEKEIEEARIELDDLKVKLSSHKDFTPVTKMQADAQKEKVSVCVATVEKLGTAIDNLTDSIKTTNEKIQKIELIRTQYDIVEFKRQLETYKRLEASVATLRYKHEKEQASLKQQERALVILNEVPCGDDYPSCKFIKDAHVTKGTIDQQRILTREALCELEELAAQLSNDNIKDLQEKVTKCEQLNERCTQLKLDVSNKATDIAKLEAKMEQAVTVLNNEKQRLQELDDSFKNEENAEVVSLRREIDNLAAAIKRMDLDRLGNASERGKIQSQVEKLKAERTETETLQSKMRVHELVTNAFSRKGIPNTIVRSQLPVINLEIAKILQGIVDFTIELVADEESNAMDVFINYGDSRRIIELCSGMEKMISSIAIRVALCNVTSLPKTDMFLIDEGFGVLDGVNIEACNSLLVALKKYFKSVLIISHVDGIKDIVDNMLEITKNEKDSKVTWN